MRIHWSSVLAFGVALRAFAGTVGAADQTPLAAVESRPLLSRPANGSAKFRGLATAITAGVVVQWPVELTPVEAARKACAGTACSEWQRLEQVLNRAAQWMAGFPPEQLRFDAAVVLSQIRKSVDSIPLRIAFKRARAFADHDNDHPQRRFWIPQFHTPAKYTSQWPVPTDGQQRVNSNRVLHEALYCPEYGWRQETMRYVCGPMRDDGGYQTTHALWALTIAYRNGCIAKADFEPCARALQRELVDKQPAVLEPRATLDIDLYAERLLQPVLSGYPDPIVNQWAHVLIGLQGADGSWGVPAAGEDPYYRYHTTMMCTWALAEWYRRVVGHPEVRD
jgi:hypothetical protein